MNNESNKRLDAIVANARANYEQRADGYRQRALKLYPWVCGRCSREFDHTNLRELTVHHRDHNHDNNPHDGSNWELLCVYCHDNEHQRFSDEISYSSSGSVAEVSTHNPFADLKKMLGDGENDKLQR